MQLVKAVLGGHHGHTQQTAGRQSIEMLLTRTARNRAQNSW